MKSDRFDHRVAAAGGRWCALLPILAALHAGAMTAMSQDTAPPDAVIELWEQEWTQHDDGRAAYREKLHVRLNSDRAYDEFADPRITFNSETDTLEVLEARVRRPDGSYVELPDYGHVQVGPNAAAGWPAFAALRQHVLVLSGIEPRCVAETEYRITRAAGSARRLAADVRLDHHYPIQERSVRVNVPAGVDVGVHFSGLDIPLERATEKACTWTFRNLPASPREPYASPWQTVRPRLAFSTTTSAEAWVTETLDRIEAAAQPSPRITELAETWSRDAAGPQDKLAAIRKSFAETFTFLDFPIDWRPAELRPATAVLESSYGLPEEAAALLLALAQAVDLPVRPAVLTPDVIWTAAAPQDAFASAYAVVLDAGGERTIWDPQHGRIVRDAHWAGHTLRYVNDGDVHVEPLPSWKDAGESRIRVAGRLVMDAEGRCTGELALDSTGLFVSTPELETRDAQQGRIRAVLNHVVPGLSGDEFSVARLADGVFSATVPVKSKEPLAKLGPCHALKLAEQGPAAVGISLPLASTVRENPVWLAGAFDESVDLTIEWPEGWQTAGVPRDVERIGAGWRVRQMVTVDGNRLRIERQVRVEGRMVPAEAFAGLREALNELASPAGRTVLVRSQELGVKS